MIQDYGRHGVNSYVVSSKTHEALAQGMVDLAANGSLRESIAQNARAMVAEKYNYDRVESHGAALMRRAVASSRIRVTPVIQSVRLVTTVHAQATGNSSITNSTGVPPSPRELEVQRECVVSNGVQCPAQSDSVNVPLFHHQTESEVAAYSQGDGSLSAAINVSASVARTAIQIMVDLRTFSIPDGFGDVWQSAAQQLRADLEGIEESEVVRAAVGSLFEEWHGRRSVVCLELQVERGTADHESRIQQSCSRDFGSVHHSGVFCDDNTSKNCRLAACCVPVQLQS